MADKKKRKRIKKVFISKAYPLDDKEVLTAPEDDGHEAIYLKQ